jgi:hypothetical protein
MSSNIKTSQINTSYPVPGINNSTQGFRTNFSAIKAALDTATSEISDLQSKVVLKSALTDMNIDNNMANTLISNALVRGFRAKTFKISDDMSGTITIDTTAADVQYGTITDDTDLGFSKWAPDGTQATVDLILTIDNAASVITLPDNVTQGMSTLENYSGDGIAGGSFTAPSGVSNIHLRFTTIDCGTNIEVQALNRPRQAQQIVTTVPTTKFGSQGDRAGSIATDSTYVYVCTADWDGTTAIWKRLSLTSWT